MTIDEAIERLISMKRVFRSLAPPKEQEALSLGIEALKRVKSDKEKYHYPSDFNLPGETE